MRGVISDSARCALCNEAIEGLDHLFIGCRKSAEVRTEINKISAMLPDTLNNLEELFTWMGDSNQSKEGRVKREVIGNAYLWGLWRGRNDCVFNNKVFNSSSTTSFIISSLYLWVSSRAGSGNVSNWPVSWL